VDDLPCSRDCVEGKGNKRLGKGDDGRESDTREAVLTLMMRGSVAVEVVPF
jgi:hypothetical protein